MSIAKGKFTHKKHQAIVALLETPTVKEAAQSVGIAEATLHRWLQDSDFLGTYRKAKRGLVDSSITRLQRITGEAVEALRSVMNDFESPPSSRVMAARAVLEMAIKSLDVEDLLTRVEALEKLMENRNGKT